MTKILQVNFGKLHAEYKDKLQGIGERLEYSGVPNLRDSKKPDRISLAAVIRHLIDNHFRLWQTTSNQLDYLVKSANGRMSRADIINLAINSLTSEDIQMQLQLEDASELESQLIED